MDGGAWWAAVHGAAKSRTRLSDFTSLQVYSKAIQIDIYIYVLFQILFHYRVLQDIDYYPLVLVVYFIYSMGKLYLYNLSLSPSHCPLSFSMSVSLFLSICIIF